MHASVDVRGPRFLDGLHYSFSILDDLQSELYDHCIRIESAPGGALAPALWRCWSFIDQLHRIRQLTAGLPGLSKKAAEVKAFMQATDLAEDFRHYIQHLSGELSRVPPDPSPVWGSLSWVSPDDPMLCFTALFGAQIKGTTFSSCVFDSEERRWVSRVTLTTRTASFNFDPIYERCVRFRDFILPWALKTYGLDGTSMVKPVVLSARLELSDAELTIDTKVAK